MEKSKNSNSKVNNINIKKRKYKLDKNSFIKGVAITAAAVTLFGSIIGFSNKKTSDKYMKTYSYISLANDYSDEPEYDTLEEEASQMYDILQYIELSEKLERIDLDKYDVEAIDVGQLLSVDDIELLINKYGISHNDEVNGKSVIGILKDQKNKINRDLFESYQLVAKYLLDIIKINLKEKYNIDPLNCRIENIRFEFSDGIFHCDLVDGNDVHHIDSSKDPSLRLLGCVLNLQSQKTEDENKQQAYNPDRCELLKEGIMIGNRYAKIIYNKTR